ncbi:SRPBCC domain-containing protein [Microbacterium deminutum]|uniref:Activator of Hsp90 ATPase homologue 1/2-like C-terminal domain-containing protein n=1 Tax=Microbacterium deminutum TaxID=344164 RepID=A0ABP5C2Q0_9MICO
MVDLSRGFTVQRVFDASAEQIWRAWTDPDEVAHWWHPRGATTPRESVELDPRVGGAYRYTMVNDATGDDVTTGGVYRTVVPVERLAFTWGDPGADPDESPVVTISIVPAGDLTRLSLELRGADGMKGDGYLYDGWESALDSLAEHLGQTAVHG